MGPVGIQWGSHCIASAVQALQAPPFCAALPFCSLRMGGQPSGGWGSPIASPRALKFFLAESFLK